MSTPEVFVHSGGDLLAAAAAARCVTRLADAISARGHAHLVLTGGGIGTKVLAAIAAAPARDAVDWRRVEFWWGDERFVPAGDPERNETGARAALLDSLGVPETLVHRISGPDGPDGDDPDAAAAWYARELAASAGPGREVPAFDVLMLGIGPEGHVASIFPGSPAAHAAGSVVAVRNSPKPPPTRISLTFSALQAAREVWVLASGAEKAEAVAEALASQTRAGVSQERLPAAGARGLDRTLFLLDEAAAAKLSLS